jgi:hypothetical protein
MLLVDLPLFLAASASVSSFYVVSQKEIYKDWKRKLKYIPFLMSLGIGMCLNNALAVLEGLFGREARFVRTPKYRIESSSDAWQVKSYRGSTGCLPWVEIGLGLYLTVAVAYAAAHQVIGTVPFLVLFQVGFLYTGFMSLLQERGFRLRALRACKALIFPSSHAQDCLTRVGRHG